MKQSQAVTALTRTMFIILVAISFGAVRAAEPTPPELTEHSVASIELPLLAGWFEGKLIHYISTDMSDQKMAQSTGTNFVPRLRKALRPAGTVDGSAVDRVYKFVNFDQGSVFPSAPNGAGDKNTSSAYTPLWVVYMVTWQTGSTPHTLHSEEEVLDAADKQWIKLSPTDIVVNCPIIYLAKDNMLEGAKVRVK